MRVGQARKRDRNEAAIVQALVKFGAQVLRLNGAGIPDLAVHYRGRVWLMEVKSATGTLTEAQQACDFPREVVRSPEDALGVLIRVGRAQFKRREAHDSL